jgi:hypothetical protein
MPILLNATSLFPNYSSDTLGLIVLNLYDMVIDGNDDTKLMIMRCKEKLIEIATQDILILAKNADFPKEDSLFIFETYAKAHKKNLLDEVIGNVEKANDKEMKKC